MTELQIYYCDNDAVHTDPVGLDFGQFDKYVKHEESMAEIERYKRAVEWCLENGAGGSTNDSDGAFAVRDCKDQLLCPPADIADIICPAAGATKP